MPEPRQVNKAIPCLRQAFEIAAMIEGMDGHAPDHIIDRHRQQFQFQFEQIAMRLGYRIERAPKLEVVNTEPNVMR